jgi:uncharacterized protein
MNIKDKINDDMKAAMKGGDKPLRDLLRTLSAAMKQAEVDGQKEIGDEEAIQILKKELKKRQETIADLEKMGRPAEQEAYEQGVIESYLPAQLDRAKIEALAREAIAESGATSAKEMGAVMKVLMPRLKGAADGKLVNEVVKALLP